MQLTALERADDTRAAVSRLTEAFPRRSLGRQTLQEPRTSGCGQPHPRGPIAMSPMVVRDGAR